MIDPQPTGSHYIAGTYRDDPMGDALPVIYPATGDTIATLKYGSTCLFLGRTGLQETNNSR